MPNQRTPTQIDDRIAKTIHAVRRQAGVSQEQLAEAIGVTFQQVQKYEIGKNRVSAGRLFAIARALGVPIETFYGTAGAKGEAHDTMIDFLDLPHANRLLKACSVLSDQQRLAVARLAEAFTEGP